MSQLDRARLPAGRRARALLCCGVLVSCAHLDERAEREQREMRSLRVAAEGELVRLQEARSNGAPGLYCLGWVRILGEEPPTWEVADEDPEGVAALASLHAAVAPASACERVLGLDEARVARTVRMTVERIDLPEPTRAVVRVAVWTRDGTAPGTSARGEGWAVRLVRVAERWDVERRERTWTR